MRKDKNQPFRILSTFESVYKDYRNGATLAEVAETLYKCGFTTHSNNIEYAAEIIAREAAKN